MIQTDVCVLGAGPGGAAAALHLANQGIPSLLVDKARFPRDKICGDALSGKVINELNRISPNLVAQVDTQPTQLPSWGIHFIAPNGKRISVPFKPGYHPVTDAAPGYVCRRVDFDNILLDEVRRRPEITLMEGQELTEFRRSTNQFIASDQAHSLQIAATLLIVADGAHSRFARHVAGLPVDPKYHCAGLRAYYHNVTGMDADNFIELHFLKEALPGYLWIFPLPDGFANVGIGMLSSHISRRKINLRQLFCQLIESTPALKQRFGKAVAVDTVKGYSLPLGSKRRPISGDNYLLVGDAAHLIDPFTGEGISNAMISGRWAAVQAAKSIQAGDFSASFTKQYDQSVYNRLGAELSLSYRMQQLLGFPWLFNLVANRAANNPALAGLFSSMFLDMDVRKQLSNPAFYWKLLLNRS